MRIFNFFCKKLWSLDDGSLKAKKIMSVLCQCFWLYSIFNVIYDTIGTHTEKNTLNFYSTNKPVNFFWGIFKLAASEFFSPSTMPPSSHLICSVSRKNLEFVNKNRAVFWAFAKVKCEMNDTKYSYFAPFYYIVNENRCQTIWHLFMGRCRLPPACIECVAEKLWKFISFLRWWKWILSNFGRNSQGDAFLIRNFVGFCSFHCCSLRWLIF